MLSKYDLPIDIFVICYKQKPVLNQCLESIRKYTANIRHRVFVIEGERSAAENRNIALSHVKSPWFVIMDDDVTVSPSWLETMMRYVDDRIGQIQPKLLLPNGRIFGAEKVFTTPWGDDDLVGRNQKDKGQFDYIRVAESLSGTCCLYNSKILDKCSFDVNYGGTQWEDCDFSMQIVKNGWHLLYCGEASVVHYHLYRNPNAENLKYFKEKWFGKRELCRRGVLYVGFACDINCIFCYYKYESNKKFRPLQELIQESDDFKYHYNNTHVDISGGEPTIYPNIVNLIEHCRSIELLPTIITHGQKLSKELVQTLKSAGIEDFLISYHGPEKQHNQLVDIAGGYKLMRSGIDEVNNAGIPFRINTVVTKINYQALPILAHELLDLKPNVVNFIMFNPFEEWIGSSKQEFQVCYRDASPYLMDATSILSSRGIEVNVRYMPFCLFSGYEKHIMNFPQMPFDSWEWDFKHGHQLQDEYDYLYYALRASHLRYEKTLICQKCSLKLICSGLPKQYVREFGHNELQPRRGMLVRDPLHFKTQKAGVVNFIDHEHPLCVEMRESRADMYKTLKYTDPLILYQFFPKDVGPLYTMRKNNRDSKRVIRKAVDIAGVLGGRWLKQRLPRSFQERVSAVIKRATN